MLAGNVEEMGLIVIQFPVCSIRMIFKRVNESICIKQYSSRLAVVLGQV